MSILVDKNTRLLGQGITGREGLFHTERMVAYGTNVAAGVTPGKGGDWILGGKIPVFDKNRIDQIRKAALENLKATRANHTKYGTAQYIEVITSWGRCRRVIFRPRISKAEAKWTPGRCFKNTM